MSDLKLAQEDVKESFIDIYDAFSALAKKAGQRQIFRDIKTIYGTFHVSKDKAGRAEIDFETRKGMTAGQFLKRSRDSLWYDIYFGNNPYSMAASMNNEWYCKGYGGLTLENMEERKETFEEFDSHWVDELEPIALEATEVAMAKIDKICENKMQWDANGMGSSRKSLGQKKPKTTSGKEISKILNKGR